MMRATSLRVRHVSDPPNQVTIHERAHPVAILLGGRKDIAHQRDRNVCRPCRVGDGALVLVGLDGADHHEPSIPCRPRRRGSEESGLDAIGHHVDAVGRRSVDVARASVRAAWFTPIPRGGRREDRQSELPIERRAQEASDDWPGEAPRGASQGTARAAGTDERRVDDPASVRAGQLHVKVVRRSRPVVDDVAPDLLGLGMQPFHVDAEPLKPARGLMNVRGVATGRPGQREADVEEDLHARPTTRA